MNELILDEFKKRKEIINTFHKNYLLEAGAGAGKTTIIVERIINHILYNDIDPSNIVAITFTKAASTELSERIQKRALEYILGETDPVIIDKLKSVDKIFTGTIHSFCELILSELPFDANLTPGYEIIEDDMEFHNNIWHKFLRDKENDYEELVNFLEYLNIDYLKLNTSVFLALNNPDIDFIGYDKIDYRSIFRDFEDIKNKYKDLKYKELGKQKSIARLINPLLTIGGELKEYISKFNNAFNKEDFIYDIEELFLELHNSKTKIEDPDGFKDLIKDLYILNENIKIAKHNATTDFVNMVIRFKKENFIGKLTFNDLLFKAYSLIKESDYAREHLKNKYKYFYIDESQDTDPMQAQLIMYLAHKGNYEDMESWEDLEPEPGSLFVVGDPKQSIYRFRRADISIYNKVKRLIEKSGEVVYLDINFRSSDGICKWVEETFKSSNPNNFGFLEDTTAYQAGFKKILSLWDDSIKEKSHKYEQLKGIYSYESPEADDKEYVANIVKNLLENYYISEKIFVDEIDSEGRNYINELRPIRESDIMILTKTNKETGIYLSSLKEQGISSLLSGEKILGNTREVLNLFFLVDAIFDYGDNIKLVAALRNSFYLDLETIDLISKENDLSKFIFNSKKREKIAHPLLRKAFLSLYNMIVTTRGLNPISFLERIIQDEVGIFDPNNLYGELELKGANSSLRQAIEILKSKKCNSYYLLIEELKKLIEKEVNNELPLNEHESKNAVRIMNIHKSKGLEANIVILANGFKKRGTPLQSPSHFISRENHRNNIGYISYPQRTVGAPGPNEEQNKIVEKNFINAEIDRLLYVAATRTKSALIVAKGDGEQSFLYPLSSKIQNRDIVLKEQLPSESGNIRFSANKEKEQLITNDILIREEISKTNYIKISPSKFRIHKSINNNINKRKTVISKSPKLKYKTILNKDKIKYLKEKTSYGGPIYGTIIHRAMELLMKKSDYLKKFDEAQIDSIAEQSLNEVIDSIEINSINLSKIFQGFSNKNTELMKIKLEKGTEFTKIKLKDDLKEKVKEVLLKFANNMDMKSILENSKEVFVEMPFTISINSENKNTHRTILNLIHKDDEELSHKSFLINGTIDLIIKNMDNTWSIVDYKTNRISRRNIAGLLKDIYSGQLTGYKILFEEILKNESEKVRDLIIYSTEIDKLIYL